MLIDSFELISGFAADTFESVGRSRGVFVSGWYKLCHQRQRPIGWSRSGDNFDQSVSFSYPNDRLPHQATVSGVFVGLERMIDSYGSQK